MSHFRAGGLTAQNAAGNQSVSGFGFQPGAELFVCTAGTNNGTITRMMLGAAKSSSQRAAAAYWADGLAGTSTTSRGFKSDEALISVTSDVAADVFELVSQDADGYTVGWEANNNGLFVNYLALPSEINSKVGTFDTNTVAGNQSITGLGFKPKVLIFFSSLPNTTEGGAADAFLSFGAAASPTSRACTAYRDRDAQGTMDSACYMADNKAFVQISTAAVIFDFDLVSMDPDGFTINIGTTDGVARRIAYLALDGVDAIVGTCEQNNGTGNRSYTGLGFQPEALVFFGSSAVTLNAMNASPRFTVGFATAATQRGYCCATSDNGVATSYCCRRQSSTKCVGAINDATSATGALVCEADLVSLDSDGYTLNWTTADANLRNFFHLALRVSTPAVGAGLTESNLLERRRLAA